MTVRMAMTIATIGRRMKNSATALASALRLRGGRRRGGRGRGRGRRRLVSAGLPVREWPQLGLHLHARTRLLHPLDNDALAGLEPGGDDVELLIGLAQRHGPER